MLLPKNLTYDGGGRESSKILRNFTRRRIYESFDSKNTKYNVYSDAFKKINKFW